MRIPFILALATLIPISSARLYQTNCSHCHGNTFQGGSAQSLIDGVWRFGNSAGYITRNIKFGITHLGMPAYGKTLSEKEIKVLGGDELNLIFSSVNYGWPIITEFVRNEGMQQPVWYWKPSTAVCGIDFYRGDLFPKWNCKLLAGSLKYEDLRVLDIEKDRVMHEEVILKNAGRVRDVVCGPDGASRPQTNPLRLCASPV